MTETTMDRSIAYALKMVGCSDFALKPEQLACVTHLCEGQDVFLWLPTGSGKSLCYEVLPFAIGDKIGRSDSVAIVFSPLISLMTDQVRSLRSRNVRAAILSSGGKVDKTLVATDDDIAHSNLLFCAPEVLDVPKWRDTIAKSEFSSKVVALVVDEAHCVSKWYVHIIAISHRH